MEKVLTVILVVSLVMTLGFSAYQSVEIAELEQKHEWAIEFSKLDRYEKEKVIESARLNNSI